MPPALLAAAITALLLGIVPALAGGAQPASRVEKLYGIHVRNPGGWKDVTAADVEENLGKLDRRTRDKLMRDLGGNVLVKAYVKYDPGNHPGLIPTIQVNARPNRTRSFRQFYSAMAGSEGKSGNPLKDFEILEGPDSATVGGRKAYHAVYRYTLVLGSGYTAKARSRVYAIPREGYFLQLNLTDGPEIEDCSKTFDEVVGNLRFLD